MNFRTACLFVDGENLRHSICDLFTPPDFHPSEYLPKQADWHGFFEYLVDEAKAELRLRTYWYTVAEIDFWPFGLHKLLKPQNYPTLETVMRKNTANNRELAGILDPNQRGVRAKQMAQDLFQHESEMRTRFDGWHTVQNGIASQVDSVEFRRAGSIRYDLFTRSLGSEKGVDVKLATDLIRLKDIYDVAIILSGDGDYVPAVQAVKDSGKHVINVSFLRKSGGILPGGARRLNQATDRTIEVEHSVSEKYLLQKTVSPTATTP